MQAATRGDEELIERARTGDREAYAAVLRPVLPGALRLARALLGGPEEAEDAVQEAAVKGWLNWGDLDYLLVDMPPGTGDIQMGLARMLPRAEMLIVTTPALAAQKVAVRAADMARKGYLRVAGVIENMSGFTCGHGEHYELFGSGGGERLAQEIGVPLLARIPLEPAVSAGGDTGEPAALGQGQAAVSFAELVDAVVEVAPVLEMQNCTARMLDAVDGALAARNDPA